MKQDKETNEQNIEPIAHQKIAVNKIRGHTIDVLNNLILSAGKTLASISDGTFIAKNVLSTTLWRMKNKCLIEKIENFGWRITSYGIEVLKILFNKINTNTNTNKLNTSTTTTQLQQQCTANLEKEIPKEIPTCFQSSVCVIKRFWKDHRFSRKHEVGACEFCCRKDRDTTYMKNPFYDSLINSIRNERGGVQTV